MKSKSKIIKYLFILVAIFLFFLIINYFFDTYFNGKFKEFIYQTIGHSYYSKLTVDDTNYFVVNWFTLKPLLKFLFFFFLIGISFLIILMKGIEKQRYRRLILELSEKLDLTSNETITLSEEYKELENKINNGKLILEKNRQLAKEIEDRKNDLLVYLAHDLKTPLTSIIGYLSFLEEMKELSDKQRKKYIRIVLDKSYRLEELINELFDIARFNSERILLNKRKINLLFMLEQIREDFYPILKKEKKKLEINSREEIELFIDCDKMARVFGNIIKNAISYSFKDSVIQISLWKEAEFVRVVFFNYGERIPEDKLLHIFEKFYRVDEARCSQTGNAGVGLAIAKEIVELHGGLIWAESEEEGTSFHIQLPILESKDSKDEFF